MKRGPFDEIVDHLPVQSCLQRPHGNPQLKSVPRWCKIEEQMFSSRSTISRDIQSHDE